MLINECTYLSCGAFLNSRYITYHRVATPILMLLAFLSGFCKVKAQAISLHGGLEVTCFAVFLISHNQYLCPQFYAFRLAHKGRHPKKVNILNSWNMNMDCFILSARCTSYSNLLLSLFRLNPMQTLSGNMIFTCPIHWCSICSVQKSISANRTNALKLVFFVWPVTIYHMAMLLRLTLGFQRAWEAHHNELGFLGSYKIAVLIYSLK